ncbi:MAG: VanZ family protein [Caulobacteraceae bacterium]|nr:VanZ family protein [Caulobacteraceae bacterium]
MRLTPALVRTCARLTLALSSAVAAYLLFAPGAAVDHMTARYIPWDKAAHFIGFYGLTTLTLLSFPRNRRADLTMILLLCGASSEVIQGLVGRDGDLYDFLADLCGVAAVVGPMTIDRLRLLMRAEPNSSLSALQRQGERRGAGRTPRSIGQEHTQSTRVRVRGA